MSTEGKILLFPLKKTKKKTREKQIPGKPPSSDKTDSEEKLSSLSSLDSEKDQSIQTLAELFQNQIVDIGSKREEIIENERRSVKRTILNGFIGVHVVVPENRRQKRLSQGAFEMLSS